MAVQLTQIQLKKQMTSRENSLIPYMLRCWGGVLSSINNKESYNIYTCYFIDMPIDEFSFPFLTLSVPLTLLCISEIVFHGISMWPALIYTKTDKFESGFVACL